MNRQMKRAQERAERLEKRAGAERKAAAATPGMQPDKRGPGAPKRAGARQFLKEVRLELKKVDWPTRKELVTYSVVVVVTIAVVTSFVFGLDAVFSRVIFSFLS